MRIKSNFFRGIINGMPICLGYLSVSFAFGILSVRLGLSCIQAVIISITNLTSAGQAAGVDIIAAGGTLIEMALVQLIINLRYSLMALSLSQNLDKSFTFPHRLIAAYGITDEIFAVCSTNKEPIKPSYMYGLIFISALGWIGGTFIGAAAGEMLPRSITSALGIVLYAMFIAIILPPSAKHFNILIVVIFSAALSVVCKFLLPSLSSGFSIILCALISSIFGAIIFPKKEEIEK